MEPAVHRAAGSSDAVLRREAVAGIAGWYQRRLAAVDLLAVRRPRWGRIFRLPDVVDHGFTGADDALTAMDADWPAVPPVCRLLFAEGRYGFVHQLSEAMHGYCLRRQRFDEWIACPGLAVAAAGSDGSQTAAARARLEPADAHRARSPRP
ncbi:hypothetical protein [Streptomyces sp. RFCAC02]|uniref:hypothetical protein n=1 Tax=Streptomyces sp. RFCAC02 TaxID=2499143 RepID=UPI00101F4509|nr:hypothetical protein [Streptomyces sp. RFCAC02]